MKYLPLVGFALVILGLVTGDMIQAIVGGGLFAVSFVIYFLKQSSNLNDDKVFTAYKTLKSMIDIVRNPANYSDSKIPNEKLELAQALFIFGMIDSVSQMSQLNDEQWGNLLRSVFNDLDHIYDQTYLLQLLNFHQSHQFSHPAYSLIMQGGELGQKFLTNNQMALLVASSLIEDAAKEQSFPSTIAHL